MRGGGGGGLWDALDWLLSSSCVTGNTEDVLVTVEVSPFAPLPAGLEIVEVVMVVAEG